MNRYSSTSVLSSNSLMSSLPSTRTSLATEISITSPGGSGSGSLGGGGSRLSFNNKLLKSMTSFYRKSTSRDSVSSIASSYSVTKDEKKESCNALEHQLHQPLHQHQHYESKEKEDEEDALTSLAVNPNALKIAKNRCSMIPVPVQTKNNNNNSSNSNKSKEGLTRENSKPEQKHNHRNRVSDLISRLSSPTASSRAKQLQKPDFSKRSLASRNKANNNDTNIPSITATLESPPTKSTPKQPTTPPSQTQFVVTSKRPSTPSRRPATPVRQRQLTPLRQRPLTPLRQRPLTPLKQRPSTPTKRQAVMPRSLQTSRSALPASRASSNTTSRTALSPHQRSIPVAELKTKLTELESALTGGWSKYEMTAEETLEHSTKLEQLLKRERQENARLQKRISMLENASSGLPNLNQDEKENNSSLKKTSINYKKQYQDLHSLFNTQLVQFQKIISDLKLQKETLRNKNSSLASEVDSLRVVLENNQLKIQKLECHLNNKQSKIDTLTTNLKSSQDNLLISLKDLEKKNIEISNLSSNINVLNNQTNLYLTNIKSLEREIELLHSKIQRDNWNFSKQYNTHQRELRRKTRMIVTLETALQDVKISLEEKEMENDELNNSIMKLMEHANQTIKGVRSGSSSDDDDE